MKPQTPTKLIDPQNLISLIDAAETLAVTKQRMSQLAERYPEELGYIAIGRCRFVDCRKLAGFKKNRPPTGRPPKGSPGRALRGR